MTGAATASAVIASVIALVDWVAVQRRWRVVEWVCKPAVMVALVAMALSLHPLVHTARAWFVGALVLSLAGDVFLMLPPDGRFVEVICAAGTGLRLAIVGAALFYVSDALIAWNRFVAPVRGGKVAIIVTYHLAQLALVASLAR